MISYQTSATCIALRRDRLRSNAAATTAHDLLRTIAEERVTAPLLESSTIVGQSSVSGSDRRRLFGLRPPLMPPVILHIIAPVISLYGMGKAHRAPRPVAMSMIATGTNAAQPHMMLLTFEI